LNDFVNPSAKPHRLLSAWLSPQEFVTLLQNGKIASPDDIARQQPVIASSLAALASRPVYVPESPIMEIELDPLLASLRQRPDIQAVHESFQWEPAMVNLEKVLSYQPIVNLDGLEDRVGGTLTSLEQLYQLCFPALQAAPLPMPLPVDQWRFAFHSPNPNFRLAGMRMNLNGITQQGTMVHEVIYTLSFMPSYLQVVHFSDRYILRDGYHRAVGLLMNGVAEVPCILIEAQSIEQIGFRPGLFPPAVVFGEKPPLLVDFLDDRVSQSIMFTPAGKSILIEGTEFPFKI
jgi:hypothetical protein